MRVSIFPCILRKFNPQCKWLIGLRIIDLAFCPSTKLAEWGFDFQRFLGYRIGLSMRRLLAITVIAGLICSTGMPVWASACEAMHKTPMCHRTAVSQSSHAAHAQHHCDMMAQEEDAAASSESASLVKDHPNSCPMQCCMQATAGNGSAIPAAAFIAILLSSEAHVYVPAITFSTPGFSSHTDRGPPVV